MESTNQPTPVILSDEDCSVSTHEFKLHDWRWLGWPLSNTSARGRWCRLCGMAQGEPQGQCQTANCLEYAAGGNDVCESCQQRRAINDAATRMREACVSVIRAAGQWCDNCPHRAMPANADGSCSAYGYNGVDRQPQPCMCHSHNPQAQHYGMLITALESLTLDQAEKKQ